MWILRPLQCAKTSLKPLQRQQCTYTSLRQTSPFWVRPVDYRTRQHVQTPTPLTTRYFHTTRHSNAVKPDYNSLTNPLIAKAIQEAQSKESTTTGNKAEDSTPASTTTKPPRLIWKSGTKRISHRKLNLVARLIRGMTIDQAKTQLKFCKKKGAPIAIALLDRIRCQMPHNYNANPSDYYIHTSYVGKGITLKRMRFHGRGRFGIEHRRSSNISVVLKPIKVYANQEEKELDKLRVLLNRRNVYVQLKEPSWKKDNWKRIRGVPEPWDKHAWKYVRKEVWTTTKRYL